MKGLTPELTPLPDGQSICTQGWQQSLCEERRGLPQVGMDIPGYSNRFCRIPTPQPLSPQNPDNNVGGDSREQRQRREKPSSSREQRREAKVGKRGIAHPLLPLQVLLGRAITDG